MSFLQEDYKLPENNNNYMKLLKGNSTFRVLSDAITGYMWWTDVTVDGKQVRKPVRVRQGEKIANGAEKPKHFWAMIVWNYAEKRIQMLEITQSSIQQDIMTHYQDENWGDPKGYDITIIKTGDGLETKYSTKMTPPKPISDDIAELYSKTIIDINMLYSGGDPFNTVVDSTVGKPDPFAEGDIDMSNSHSNE